MGRSIGRYKRDDLRAVAAIRDADNALSMIDTAIYELRGQDSELIDKFNKFASILAKKLSASVTKSALKESEGNYGDIKTWIIENERNL